MLMLVTADARVLSRLLLVLRIRIVLSKRVDTAVDSSRTGSTHLERSLAQ